MKPVDRFIVLLFTGTCAACGRSEPPGAKSIAEAQPRPVGVSSAPHADGGLNAKASSSGSANPSIEASAVAVRDAAAPSDGGALVDEHGQPKPQTNDQPVPGDPIFQSRIALLCESIVEGRPDMAHDAFFPLVAYRQVKAIEDPDRDYRLRLLRHFDRDILDYHRRISKRPSPVRCSGIKVPEAQARWMKPASEFNRIGYFRVLRSQLGLTDASGNTFSLEVTSLISWRGQWYVVHLNGFE